MTLFTVRRTIATAAVALVSTTLATPASAHELNEDAIAAKICPAGVAADGAEYSESAESGDQAEVDLYAYAVGEDLLGNPLQLCTFAIVSTDDGSTLVGDYTLTVASTPLAPVPAPATGTVAGEAFVTAPIVTTALFSPSATVTSAGKQLTPKTSKQKKSAATKYSKSAKAAKTKYSKAVKAAKAKYKKAGKTAKAKQAMGKKIAAAKKKYRAALTSAAAKKKRQTAPTERSYKLNLTLPYVD